MGAATGRTEALSRLQVGILLHVLNAYRWALAPASEAERARLWAAGVGWRPRGRTPTRRAVISRALWRLERRGLVERVRPAGRTVAVRFTSAGVEAATRLTGTGP